MTLDIMRDYRYIMSEKLRELNSIVGRRSPYKLCHLNLINSSQILLGFKCGVANGPRHQMLVDAGWLSFLKQSNRNKKSYSFVHKTVL